MRQTAKTVSAKAKAISAEKKGPMTAGRDGSRIDRGASGQRRPPLYRQVEEHIKSLLSSSDYAAGDRIPSERDFALSLNLNRATIRKAVNNLVGAGLLESNGTGGTRVAAPKLTRKVDIYKSIGVGRVITGTGGTSSNSLLHFHTEPAGARIAEHLGVDEKEDVTVLRRLWKINDTPFCIETSYLVSRLVPGLAAEDLVGGQSLYGLLASRYGIETTNAERTITIAHVNELEARLLGMQVGAAALALRLLVETREGRAIEYMSSINNPKMVVFRADESIPLVRPT